LQAINKLNEARMPDIFFNIEDEGVVKVLAQILTNILHNSLLHDNKEVFYQDLLKVLEVVQSHQGCFRVELNERSAQFPGDRGQHDAQSLQRDICAHLRVGQDPKTLFVP
jgi:hypothetical protein